MKQQFGPDCILLHVLGMSEVGRLTRLFISNETEIQQDVVPVGYSVPDRGISTLDEAGEPLAAGPMGEIVGRSAFLSPGHWPMSETAQHSFDPGAEGSEERTYRTGNFGTLLPHGCLLFGGRKDLQGKIG